MSSLLPSLSQNMKLHLNSFPPQKVTGFMWTKDKNSKISEAALFTSVILTSEQDVL